MKLNAVETKISGNTEIKAQTFAIRDPVFISKLLSNIYSNPIQAVVREYICNAIDSHKLSGTEREFEIYAPTMIDPNFVVKDFGVGLSHDDVIDLMTAYGGSNKRESNELIGGFGAGSKSAFAYRNDFSFESVYSGVKSIYLCYMDDKKGPQVELLSQTKTDDPNGVSVKINVKSHDYQRFQNEINLLCRGFDESIKFKLFNCTFVPLEPLKVINNFTFLNRAFRNSDITIRMGGIVYDVHGVRSSFNSPHIIDVPIGTFNLSPSRESIIVDDQSTEKIKKLSKETINIVLSDFYKKIDEAPTLYRAEKIYTNENVNSLVYKPQYTWKNISLGRKRAYGFSFVVQDALNHNYSIHEDKYGHGIEINTIVGILIRDHRMYKQSLEQFGDIKGGKIVVINSIDNKSKFSLLKQWVKLGKPDVPIIRASDFLSSRKSNKTNSVAAKPKIKRFKILDITKQYYEYANIDMSSSVEYYLTTDRGQIESNYSVLSCFSYGVGKLIHTYIGGPFQRIIIVPKTYKKHLPDKWINVNQLINEKTENIVQGSVDEWFKLGFNSASKYFKLKISDKPIYSDRYNYYSRYFNFVYNLGRDRAIKLNEKREKRLRENYPFYNYFDNEKDRNQYIEMCKVFKMYKNGELVLTNRKI